MRFREFTVEGRKGTLRKGMSKASSNLSTYDELDNNNNPYRAYRFGIALAGSPDIDMNAEGPIGSSLVTLDYSHGDSEIRKGAEKILGVRSSKGTGKSQESDTINTVSPVSNWNKTK